MFKKTAIAAIVFSLSSVAYAGSYLQECKPGDVTAPCSPSMWDIGVDALVLQNFSNVITPAEYHAKWGWGFRLEGSYHFGMGKDFNINWAYYNKKDNNRRWRHDGGDLSGGLKTDFNIVNFEFAQMINVTGDINLRFHAGVQYAQFTNNGSLRRSHSESKSEGVGQDYRFNGWGPRVGLDSTYMIQDGFGFFANGALSLLRGSGKTTNAHGRAEQAWLDFDNDNIDYMVFHADMKIGAKYDFTMAQGMMTARVGWEAHDFLNSIAFGDHSNRDATWSGVFFGLKWVGNA